MMRELYQEVILDHNRSPKNRREMPEATTHADGANPLCGDQLTLFLDIEDGVIRDASFVGHGCAISTASASMMTEAIRGKTTEEAEELFRKFRSMAMSDEENVVFEGELERLQSFSGVREQPVRIKCATLPWHTLHAALSGQIEATTE